MLAPALPYNALPLSFRLLRPLGTGTSPSVCLSVHLPLVNQGASPAGGDEDLRHGPQRPAVEVLRLIDPEHREPFVSLGRILLACSVTPVEALLRYNLDRLDYSTTLGGLAPFLDLWVPLKTARTIAADLGRLDELAALLEWETRGAYSVDDKEEGGLVHNWKVDSTRIPPDEYSTASMLATPFPRIHLLPPGAQVRTLLPSLLSFPTLEDRPTDPRPGLDAVWGRVVEWSIVAVEGWLGEADGQEEGGGGGQEAQQGRRARSPPSSSALASAPSLGASTSADALAPLFLFSTLAPLLQALDLLPSPRPPPSTSPSSASPAPPPPRPTATTLTHLASLPPLARAALLPPPPSSSSSADPGPGPTHDAPRLPPHATLYLADAVARLVLHARRSSADEGGAAPLKGRERERERGGEGGAARGGGSGWRAALEDRLAALERGAPDSSAAAAEPASGAPSSSSGAGVGALAAAGTGSASVASGFGGDALQRRLASLEARLEALEGALAGQKLEQAPPLAAVGAAGPAPGAKVGHPRAVSVQTVDNRVPGLFLIAIAFGVLFWLMREVLDAQQGGGRLSHSHFG